MANNVVLGAFQAYLQFRTDDKQLTKARRNFDRFQTDIKTAATGLAQVGAAGSAAIGMMAKTIYDFQVNINAMEAAARPLRHEYEAARNQAMELGKTTVFTASQAANAQKLLAQAGFTMQENLAALPNVLSTAAAGQLELGEATAIVVSIMRAYNMQAQDTTRIGDVLAATAASAKTTIQDMGFAFRPVAPIAAKLNFPLEELSASLAALQDAGFEAARGGTAMRNILLRMLSPVAAARKAMAQLDLDPVRLAEIANRGDLLQVLEILRDAGMSAAQADKIFGKFSVGQALVLSATLPKIRRLAAEYRNSAGRAKEMADVQLKGLVGAWKIMLSVLETLQLELGDAGLTSALTTAADAVRGLADWYSRLSPWILRASVMTLILISALTALGAILYVAVVTMKGLVAVARLMHYVGIILTGTFTKLVTLTKVLLLRQHQLSVSYVRTAAGAKISAFWKKVLIALQWREIRTIFRYMRASDDEKKKIREIWRSNQDVVRGKTDKIKAQQADTIATNLNTTAQGRAATSQNANTTATNVNAGAKARSTAGKNADTTATNINAAAQGRATLSENTLTGALNLNTTAQTRATVSKNADTTTTNVNTAATNANTATVNKNGISRVAAHLQSQNATASKAAETNATNVNTGAKIRNTTATNVNTATTNVNTNTKGVNTGATNANTTSTNVNTTATQRKTVAQVVDTRATNIGSTSTTINTGATNVNTVATQRNVFARLFSTVANMRLVKALQISSIWKGINTVGTKALTIATAAKTVAIGLATKAMWALNVAMFANPIGLIILGVAALIGIIGFLIYKIEPLREIFLAWVDISLKLATVLLGPVLTAVKAVGSALGWLYDKLKPIITLLTGFGLGDSDIDINADYMPEAIPAPTPDPNTDQQNMLGNTQFGQFFSGPSPLPVAPLAVPTPTPSLPSFSGDGSSIIGADRRDVAIDRLNVTVNVGSGDSREIAAHVGDELRKQFQSITASGIETGIQR